jgi:NAD(P)-dependent dehydrogenase (short-subunit alcohol dehydrogenase family)
MTSSTRVTTDFSARSTAADVIHGTDLTGHRAVVTGATSGIGIETARALASAGAEVTLAVRDTVAGRRTADDITATTGTQQIHVTALDLSDPASVGAFVTAWDGPLHILVNNAGVLTTTERRTPQGWELQFATNHLGHFALTTGLHPALAAAGGARVVSLSSNGHLDAPLDLDDIHFRKRPYDAMRAYGRSKTATALFAVEAQRRWATDGITTNTANPGAVMTNLARDYSAEQLAAAAAHYEFKTPEEGAATSILLATAPSLEGIGGRYFEDCQEAERHTPDRPFHGVADHALDPEQARRLWQVSLDALAA